MPAHQKQRRTQAKAPPLIACLPSRAKTSDRRRDRLVLADWGFGRIFIAHQRERRVMSIVLDHTIVPAHDKEESARFFARIFGLEYKGPVSHFAPVRINDTLTIDFDNWDSFERHHYAFKVSEAEFDGIFDRVRGEGLAYGSGPRSAENMEINHRNGGRGFYFRDPNGHLLEVLTA
jgi:catechol 2,3-dioxygenase-like lactoylglutathione lyase family enzyme